MIEHSKVEVNGARLNVARTGRGRPLLLLHGWPEFWQTWQPVMERLAGRFTLIAPDLRGFGDSDKPTPGDEFGPEEQAADMASLIEALDLGPVGIVSHDVGGSVTQELARSRPELASGLFFFNFLYPGIGERYNTPDHLRFVWQAYFNQSDIAVPLLRGSPDGVRLFITHFITLWAHHPEAFNRETLDAFVANFEKPGNLEGGFTWYRSAAAQRGRAAERGIVPSPIALPTCVRWADRDKALDIAWTDRLGEFFTDLDYAPFPDSGHFPHHEHPDRAAAEITGFFDRLYARG